MSGSVRVWSNKIHVPFPAGGRGHRGDPFFFPFHLVCVTWLRGVFVNWKPPAEGADQDLQEGGVEASDGRAVDGR